MLYSLANRFTTLQIRIKLIIIIGLIFIGLTSVFSFIIIQNGKKILNERLAQTCNLSLRHVSQSIKDELLFYYNSESQPQDISTHLGTIREAILKVMGDNIDGLAYAGVIDRQGTIIAHSDLDLINTKISDKDSVLFSSMTETFVRDKDDVKEYIYPLYALKTTNDRTFLGTTLIGFSKASVLKPIHQATQMIIVTFFFITVLSLGLIFYVARRMTRQIDALADGVRRISIGNLQTKIPVISNDELGGLAGEFNSMIVHLREKLQMQKFVSKLTVQMIQKRSDMPELTSDGERRTATLLFSDIRSFSAMTERLGAEEIVKLINIYLNLQAKIVEECGGIVDKYMGDQVMAIFIGKNQADAALNAAVEIQRSIRELNKRRDRKSEVVLTVGVGLHTGPVVMGNMGSKNRLDYTVIGDVVNLASRLCALAKPGQIIIPSEMIPKLTGEYTTIRLDSVKVKGRTLPVEIYEIDYDHAIII